MSMRKSYSHFGAEDIASLGFMIVRVGALFSAQRLEPSEFLLTQLTLNQQVPMESEKAKSELLITPILNEIRVRNAKKMTYFSGYQFTVDPKKGLKGYCDFIISKKWDALFIESPLIAVVEAKHNQDLLDAVPQCAAEMIAMDIFNLRYQKKLPFVYGVITNGYEWVFLQLTEKRIAVDSQRYFIQDLPHLLGAWQIILNQFDDNL